MIETMYDKLFEPYTGDGHTLESLIKYLSGIALQRNISQDIVELSMNEIFSEISSGRQFSKTKCSCGCEIDKAATDLIHTIRDRMFEIDKDKTVVVKKLMQDRYQLFLENEMKRISKFDKNREKLINGSFQFKLKESLKMPVFNKMKKQAWVESRKKEKLERVKKYTGK